MGEGWDSGTPRINTGLAADLPLNSPPPQFARTHVVLENYQEPHINDAQCCFSRRAHSKHTHMLLTHFHF